MAEDKITPLVNGVRHSYSSVRTNILGRTVSGISSINYSDGTEMEDIIGGGGMPAHRGEGNYKAECGVTLFNYEVDAILKAAGTGKRLQDITPFDVIVTYLPKGSDGLITHVIRNVQFLGNSRTAKAGDKKLEVPLKCICSHIEWNN